LVDNPTKGCLVGGAETVKTSAEYSVNHFCPLSLAFMPAGRDRKPVAARVTFFSLSLYIAVAKAFHDHIWSYDGRLA
jgi:hypothetical protein